MTLKFELENIDDLDDAVKTLYEEQDGKYRLKVEGIPAPKQDDDLAARLAKLEENNKALLAEKKAAKDAAEAAKLEAAKKGGDVEALEKSWQEKLQAKEEELTGELGNYKSMITSLTVGATASTLAAEVFGQHAELMMPHVNARLSTEIVEGRAKVRVLDKDGKPSAMSVDDLKAEFKNSDRFAAFVVGSRANGAGKPGSGGSGGGLTMTRSQFDTLSPSEKKKFATDGGRLTE